MLGRLPIVEFRGVTKRFAATRDADEVVAVEDLSFVIEQKETNPDRPCGEFVVLLGPSGCGKSTILSLIAGLALPDLGEVRVFNELVTGPHHHSATVPQAYTCFPWLNAVRNVEFGLRLEGMGEAARRKIAMRYLAKVDLAGFANVYHRQLSGGMQQRVAIARTLALKRPVVLMDEPFGALDAQTRAEMQQMLLQLWEEERNTIIFVTHDITEALLLADRIVVFSPRPASIICDMEVPFPPERPPGIVHEQEFVRCSEELRQLLRKHRPEREPLPPPPRIGLARVNMRSPASLTKGDPPLGEAASAEAAPRESELFPATTGPSVVRGRTAERSQSPSEAARPDGWLVKMMRLFVK